MYWPVCSLPKQLVVFTELGMIIFCGYKNGDKTSIGSSFLENPNAQAPWLIGYIRLYYMLCEVSLVWISSVSSNIVVAVLLHMTGHVLHQHL